MKKNCKRFLAVLLIILSLCFFTKVSTFAEETRKPIKEINLIADWFKNPEAYGEIPRGNFKFESEANGISAIMTWQEFTNKNWKDIKSKIKNFAKDKKYRISFMVYCNSNEYYISKDTKIKMNGEECSYYKSYIVGQGYSQGKFVTKEFLAKDNREKIDKINISCKEFSPPVLGDKVRKDYNFILSDIDRAKGLEVSNNRHVWYKYNEDRKEWGICTDQVFQEGRYKLAFIVECKSDSYVLIEDTQGKLNGNECYDGGFTNPITVKDSTKYFYTEEFKPKKLVDVPSVNTGLVYNGKIQKGINEDTKYVFLTENEKINAGKYKTLIKPSDEYAWSDNHKIEERYLEWEIEKADPTYTIPGNLTANLGDKLSDVKLPKGFSWEDGKISLDSLGEKSFTAIFTPEDETNYKSKKISLKIKVKEKPLVKVEIPKANLELIYDGNEKTGVSEKEGYKLTENKGINAGKYIAKAELKEGYIWEDGSKEIKEIPWEIEKADPTYTIPENLTANLGDKLSDVKLPKGFFWEDGKISLDSLGEKSFEAKYLSDNPNEKEIDHINIKVYVKEIKEPEKIKEKREDYGYFSIISQNKKVEEINKEEKNIVLKEIVLKINSKKFLVDGQEKLNDTPPIILNNRTMVPIRFIGESLGAKIEWDEKNSLVRIKDQKKKVTIEIKIGENLARVNVKEVKLTNPIFIKNNRAYGLLRFIGESLGAKVEWFKDDQKIVITK